MESACAHRSARLAGWTALLGCALAAATLLIAVADGLALGVRLGSAFPAAALLGALWWVRQRHLAPAGDPRLATSAGIVVVLFVGGLAGGLVCLVGQTFSRPFIDPLLHRADLALGVDLQAIVSGSVRIPQLPELLALAYNSSFLIIFASALGFCWTNRQDRAWELCGIFNLCLLGSTLSSALIPAAGPFHYLQFPETLGSALPPGSGVYHLPSLFALREAHSLSIDFAQLQGLVTFPSFHMALALMTADAWRDVPRLRIAMFAWQGLVILSTIPIGGHYIVDLIAGALWWWAVRCFWRRAVAGAPVRAALPTLTAWPSRRSRAASAR